MYKHNHWFGVLSAFVFISLGFTYVGFHLRTNQLKQTLSAPASFYTAELLDLPTTKPRSVALSLALRTSELEGELRQLRGIKLLAYTAADLQLDTLLPGDIVRFSSQPQEHRSAPNPEQFDYGRYLESQGIVGTVYLREDVQAYRPKSRNFRLHGVFVYLRRIGIQHLREGGIPERELGVIAALVLGKRDMVDPEVREAFTTAGTVHLLAVSGLHVGIVYLFISIILTRILPGRKLSMLRLILSLAMLWLYAGIAGFSPSVLRAATMFSFIALGKEYNRFGNVYNMLAVSACFLLLIDPYLLISVGFQLSYFAVLGIVTIYPHLYAKWTAPNALLDKAWSLVAVSVSAQIATFPLSLYYFHQFPLYFIFSNVVVIPLATVLLYGGLVSMLAAWIPLVSDVLFVIVGWCTWLLNEAVMVFGSLPKAVLTGLYLTEMETIMLYLLVGALFLLFTQPSIKGLWMTLAMMVGFFGMWAFRKIDGAVHPEIVVFHLEGKSFVSAVQGKQALLYFTDPATQEAKEISFAAEAYFLSKGIDSYNFEGEAPISLPNGKMLCAASSTDALRHILQKDVEYVLLREAYNLDFNHLPQRAKEVVFIIDGSTPFYRRQRLIKQLDAAGMRYAATEYGAIHF